MQGMVEEAESQKFVSIVNILSIFPRKGRFLRRPLCTRPTAATATISVQ